MNTLEIKNITRDMSIQCRAELSTETIQDYAEAMQGGATLPAVTAFGDENACHLADGWHRVAAVEQIEQTTIEVELHEGGREEALLYALKANASNGLRRTNKDKRRAVTIAANEFQGYTNRKIAKLCAVSHSLVNSLRDESKVEADSTSKREGIDGKKYAAFKTPGKDVSIAVPAPDTDNIPPDPGTGDISPDLTAETTAKPVFNKSNDNIEWASWSWNPVTGCETGCDYCYGRDIAERFTNNFPNGFKPDWHPERLTAPLNSKLPADDSPGARNVFLCSMADLWGSWVDEDWIRQTLKACEDAPDWTFITLTKNPKRYLEFTDQIPKNMWLGSTVDTQARVTVTEDVFTQLRVKLDNPLFVSCEPLLEPIKFTEGLDCINWLIIGARSKTKTGPEFQPEIGWALDLTAWARRCGAAVYWKPNLTVRPKQYPGEGK